MNWTRVNWSHGEPNFLPYLLALCRSWLVKLVRFEWITVLYWLICRYLAGLNLPDLSKGRYQTKNSPSPPSCSKDGKHCPLYKSLFSGSIMHQLYETLSPTGGYLGSPLLLSVKWSESPALREKKNQSDLPRPVNITEHNLLTTQ